MQNIYKPIICFKNGDFVIMIAPRHTSLQTSSKKLSLSFIGPLMIDAVLDNHQYSLVRPDGKILNGMYSVNRLRTCTLRHNGRNVTNISQIPEIAQPKFKRDLMANSYQLPENLVSELANDQLAWFDIPCAYSLRDCPD